MGSGEVPLQPGQEGIIELNARRGELEAQVDYEEKISGGVFYHFGSRVDGHYLWYAHLSALYGHGDLIHTRTEDLKIKVFSDWDIRLLDA